MGGVSSKDKSRIPTIDICNVLGIGVADKVSTSTLFFNCLIFSLCFTPNLCSSSTTSNPRSLKIISSLNSLCVPITISIFPDFNPSIIFFVSFCDTNRFKQAMFTAYSLNLSKAFV